MITSNHDTKQYFQSSLHKLFSILQGIESGAELYFYCNKPIFWKSQRTISFLLSNAARCRKIAREGFIFIFGFSQYGLDRPSFPTDHITQTFSWEQVCVSLNLNRIWLNTWFFIAISKTSWCMEEKNPNNPPSMLSAIKARMSKGTRVSPAIAIVTHELQRSG